MYDIKSCLVSDKEFDLALRRTQLKNKLINIGILAHVDAGKTSVTEQMLYLCGTIRKAGRVDDGTSQTDFLEVEQRRGISVKSSSSILEYHDYQINIIDTPGHVDFAGEVERSLGVLDGAVLIVSAAEGVQAQTKLIFEGLKALSIPTIILINKIDRVGVELSSVLAQIKDELTPDTIVLQSVSISSEIDCSITSNISFEYNDVINESFFETLLMEVAQYDTKIEEEYLNGIVTSKETVFRALSYCVGQAKLYPVLFSSSKLGIGIDKLIDTIIALIPNAQTTVDSPLSGIIYKVTHDKDMGRVGHVRLFGGSIKNRDIVPIQGSDIVEKVTQIRRFIGKKAIDIGEVTSGDIGALYGLLSIKVGDIVGTIEHRRQYSLAVPLLKVQVYPTNANDISELVKALGELSAEDPLLDFIWVKEERELHLKITGTIQLEVIEELLKERYQLNVIFSAPCVLYKETPTKLGIGLECYTMPKPCWAIVELAIEPLPRGSGIIFESIANKTKLLPRYQSHVQTSVHEKVAQGIYGWEITDAKISLTRGEHHNMHTHPLDFFLATPIALLRALQDAGSTLLEPILKVELVADERLIGKIMGDVIGMRGRLESTQVQGKDFKMIAYLPVATSLDYPIEFRSITSGRGLFTAKFHEYQPCPIGTSITTPYRGVCPLDRAKWILHARSALN